MARMADVSPHQRVSTFVKLRERTMIAPKTPSWLPLELDADLRALKPMVRVAAA